MLVQASCHGTDNAAVIDALNWSQGAWRGVCMIDDKVTDAELQTLHAAGVRGARFNFVRFLTLDQREAEIRRSMPGCASSAGTRGCT